MKKYIIIFLVLFLSSCSFRKDFKIFDRDKPTNSSIEQQEIVTTLEQNNRVIIRDSWNVPHVYGHTDADAAFALAYAHAQDDFHNIHEAILKARCEYS